MRGRCLTINDIENEVFTSIAHDLMIEFPNSYVTGELLSATPTRFPCVALVEMDNYEPKSKVDSSGIEVYSNITYQLTVYSNKTSGKKSECKKVFQFVDTRMRELGFRRESITPEIPINKTVYWMSGRYIAQVKDKTIYRL